VYVSHDEMFDDVRSWGALLLKTRVGGALPIQFELTPPYNLYSSLYVEFRMQVPCVHTGKQIVIIRRARPPHGMRQEPDRLQWLRREVHAFYRHEADEWFRFDESAVFAPHEEHSK